uniref:Uncharacterized protein n=1 Tax=Caulobacter sp. (strain K31) TaxID=366602 RepID=B0SX03_CAUSK
MSHAPDDFPDEPAAKVSAALTAQMLHLTNRFEEERLKLEERTFRADPDESHDAER